jgi:hypothetical protein
VLVRIALDGEASLLGRLRPGLSVTADVDRVRPGAMRHDCNRRREGRVSEPDRGESSAVTAPAPAERGGKNRRLRRHVRRCVHSAARHPDRVRFAASAEIIVIPLSGWLSQVMSTRWLFCASAAGFTAASLL